MRTPFWQQIEGAKTVLLAGAGGGFDIFSGLPLYFALRAAGKTVVLANLSFSELAFVDGVRPVNSLVQISAETNGPANYFPERYLSEWLTSRFGPTPVFAIERTGAKPVSAAYEWLVKNFEVDTLILVDGGTDSLMRGDEVGLGTPQEDLASLVAAHQVSCTGGKYLVCIGFGVDTFHGVSHGLFLENVAALIGANGFLGSWSLTQQMEEFQHYQNAYEHVRSRMPRHPSIVSASIISAVHGWFGDRHATERTRGTAELFINPLMSMYWAFALDAVAQRHLFLDKIADTSSYAELSREIELFQAQLPKTRPWREIPC